MSKATLIDEKDNVLPLTARFFAGRRFICRRWCVGCGLLLLLNCLLAGSLLAEERIAPDYQVKAAFLLNFTKFIEWPDSAEQHGAVVCILGTDPFGTSIDRLAAVQNPKPVLVRLSSAAQAVRTCNILFISQSEIGNVPNILGRLTGSNIVTVSDIPNFVAQGGVIGLFIEEERVGFEIGLTAARKTQAVLSSKLLSLARTTE